VAGLDVEAELDGVAVDGFGLGVGELDVGGHFVAGGAEGGLAVEVGVVVFGAGCYCFEDVAVVDDVVPVLAGGDVADGAGLGFFVEPDAVSVWELCPVVGVGFVCVDVAAVCVW